MKLIINADDFGMSEGQNLGTIKCHKAGLLKSCTVMTNKPGFDQAMDLLKQYPNLHAGVHLVLTTGKCVADAKKVPSLVDKDGNFTKITDEMKEEGLKFKSEEVRIEYQAQIDKFLASGNEIDHLDSHHHSHMYEPCFEVFMEFADKLKVPVRCSDQEFTDYHLGVIKKYPNVKRIPVIPFFYADNATEDFFKDFAKYYQEYPNFEAFDLMCHPAYLDDYILSTSSYNIHRVKEVIALTSDKTKKYLKDQNIEMISYSDL